MHSEPAINFGDTDGPSPDAVLRVPVRGRLGDAGGKAAQYRAARAEHADRAARAVAWTAVVRQVAARDDPHRAWQAHLRPFHARAGGVRARAGTTSREQR